MATTADNKKAIERGYAHFHRVLGELLGELAALPDAVWIDDQGHDIREEGENSYNKAIYPLSDVRPYQKVLNELQTVQTEVLALLGKEEPPKALLMPSVLENVLYARLRRHTSYLSREVSRDGILEKYEELLDKTRTSLKAFQKYATKVDPRREAIEAEVAALEVGMEKLKMQREDSFRERIRTERVKPYVYHQDNSVTRPYLRDVGLILVGSKVKVAWSGAHRRERSDKVKLEPLLIWGTYEVYSERDWQVANPRAETESKRAG